MRNSYIQKILYLSVNSFLLPANGNSIEWIIYTITIINQLNLQYYEKGIYDVAFGFYVACGFRSEH